MLGPCTLLRRILLCDGCAFVSCHLTISEIKNYETFTHKRFSSLSVNLFKLYFMINACELS